MNHCKDCRFWKTKESQYPMFETPTGDYGDYRECHIFESRNGQPENQKPMAYAIDQEAYAATLLTAPTFGCPQWEAKEEPPEDEPRLEAIVFATARQLQAIEQLIGLRPELCFTGDNGRTVYAEAGPSIIAALWEHRRLPNETNPEWDQLDHQVRMDLLAMAAESHRWHEEGEMDDYRVQEFSHCYPGLPMLCSATLP